MIECVHSRNKDVLLHFPTTLAFHEGITEEKVDLLEIKHKSLSIKSDIKR